MSRYRFTIKPIANLNRMGKSDLKFVRFYQAHGHRNLSITCSIYKPCKTISLSQTKSTLVFI